MEIRIVLRMYVQSAITLRELINHRLQHGT